MAAASNNTPKKVTSKKKGNKKPSKYEEKLVVTGTSFEGLMKALVTPKNTTKKSS